MLLTPTEQVDFVHLSAGLDFAASNGFWLNFALSFKGNITNEKFVAQCYKILLNKFEHISVPFRLSQTTAVKKTTDIWNTLIPPNKLNLATWSNKRLRCNLKANSGKPHLGVKQNTLQVVIINWQSKGRNVLIPRTQQQAPDPTMPSQ